MDYSDHYLYDHILLHSGLVCNKYLLSKREKTQKLKCHIASVSNIIPKNEWLENVTFKVAS